MDQSPPPNRWCCNTLAPGFFGIIIRALIIPQHPKWPVGRQATTFMPEVFFPVPLSSSQWFDPLRVTRAPYVSVTADRIERGVGAITMRYVCGNPPEGNRARGSDGRPHGFVSLGTTAAILASNCIMSHGTRFLPFYTLCCEGYPPIAAFRNPYVTLCLADQQPQPRAL
jgi:hypothetical protein